MPVVFIVVLDAARDQSEVGVCVEQWQDMHVVRFERVHECLRDAVALRALQRCKAELQPVLPREDPRLPGSVGRAIVRKDCDGCVRAERAEAFCDSLRASRRLLAFTMR